MKIELIIACAASALVLAPSMSADPATETEVTLQTTLAAPNMTYHRGEVLPVEFGERDWKGYYSYGLPSAPSGMTWVLVDDDAYLVSPDTGLIDVVIRDLPVMGAVS